MEISTAFIEALAEWAPVRTMAPLGDCTTYRTGGPADVLVEPDGAEAVAAVVRIAREAGAPVTIIGGGSNLLVGDRGVDGVVLRLCEKDGRRAIIAAGDGGTLFAGAAATKERFIEHAVSAGFSGMEFMAGIPGCVGGGIIMNAGTTMGSFADILLDVDCVDRDGNARTIAVSRDMASYRRLDLGDGVIVIGARFALRRADDPAAVRRAVDEILADRKKKHPLEYPSAGSVFKNPEGHSSWKLINDAGLKGRAVGGARVSDLHTNFIINTGSATSRDILDLIGIVRETVSRTFGVFLETEVRMIGKF